MPTSQSLSLCPQGFPLAWWSGEVDLGLLRWHHSLESSDHHDLVISISKPAHVVGFKQCEQSDLFQFSDTMVVRTSLWWYPSLCLVDSFSQLGCWNSDLLWAAVPYFSTARSLLLRPRQAALKKLWEVSAEALLGLCRDYRVECCASSRDHARSNANGGGDGNIAARGKEATLLRSSAGEVRAPCGWDGGVLFASTFTLPACDKQMNLFLKSEVHVNIL